MPYLPGLLNNGNDFVSHVFNAPVKTVTPSGVVINIESDTISGTGIGKIDTSHAMVNWSGVTTLLVTPATPRSFSVIDVEGSGSTFPVTVSGSGFASGTSVTFNGATTYVCSGDGYNVEFSAWSGQSFLVK